MKKHHVMLDIDGTLVQSYGFDERCFVEAVRTVTGISINADWKSYPFVTDTGILMTFIEQQAPHYTLDDLLAAVKPVFIDNIKRELASTAATEVAGAGAFVDFIRQSEDYALSFATGGWAESAKLKLESAGIDPAGLIIASANDHYTRTEIMRCAQAKADPSLRFPVTYFGDAEWDVKACAALGINLVVIGNRAAHYQQLADFKQLDKVLALIVA